MHINRIESFLIKLSQRDFNSCEQLLFTAKIPSTGGMEISVPCSEHISGSDHIDYEAGEWLNSIAEMSSKASHSRHLEKLQDGAGI